MLEVGTPDSDDGEDAILLDASAADTDIESKLDLEDFTSGLALYTQAGSTVVVLWFLLELQLLLHKLYK